MMDDKIKNFIVAPFDSINLSQINNLDLKNDVKLYWGDEPIGFLKKGENIFSPIAEAY